ncbi:uncharacterized protein PODANS_1_17120 [Podospora anserina S mat+]|uniref:Podospora anserina S mat+ genomic DNA chromosome 1, supercontig 4 n=1 Tax=Podospora anserina (strain S / ATCC MYA-4624 / DSM 980 / FGSC 10383) TaxID=515849 RepID=B2ATV9_PODAN|nr:uncharacterized protein PODANS_1_17120 [Podospora anserina S mat+]CAP67832.1 unnamed protein product [Podospora anserina S mat+]CDP24089.1 Putative protein of unknown function [Podospora anserina S mat+]
MGSLGPYVTDPLAAMSEVQLILHAPPDFPISKNTEILGVCGVADNYAKADKYGWIVADFLAYKVGCYGLGRPSDHTWLSSLDLHCFLENVSTKLDAGPGSPMRRKIFGPNGDQITTVPANNAGFLNVLLTQIGDSAKSAASKNVPLVIFMFTPVTPEHDICIDFGEKKFLTTEEICRTIAEATGNPNLPVTLLTPSAFTGGWNCRPSLMGPSRCSATKAMELIARSSGGAFADTFMKVFTSRQSPLLAREHQDIARYDDLMPLSPTVEQKNFLHHLQGRVHEILEHGFSPFASRHTAVVNGPDPWEILAPRIGVPLKDWGPRFMDRPLYEDVRRVEFFGEAFGGERSSQLFHLCYLIDIELSTCPGDWNKKTAGMTQELYRGFTEHPNPDDDHFKQVFDALDYRASSMKLAHCVAKALHLPMPGNLKCRYWNDGYDQDDAFYKRHAAAFGEAHNLFDQVAVRPRERRHDYKVVRFLRASRWLSACIAMKFANDGTDTANVKIFVNSSVTDFITQVKDLQLGLLLQDKDVLKASSRWLAAIGFGDSRNMEILGAIDTSSPSLEVFFPSPVAPVYVDKGKGKEVAKVEEPPSLWFEKQNQSPVYPIQQAPVNVGRDGVVFPAEERADEFALQQALLNEAKFNKEKEKTVIEPAFQHHKPLISIHQPPAATPAPEFQTPRSPVRKSPVTTVVEPTMASAPEPVSTKAPSSYTPDTPFSGYTAIVQEVADKVLTKPDEVKEVFAQILQDAMKIALSRMDASADSRLSAILSPGPPPPSVVQPARSTTVEALAVNNPTPPRSPVQPTTLSSVQKSPQRAIRDQLEDT